MRKRMLWDGQTAPLHNMSHFFFKTSVQKLTLSCNRSKATHGLHLTTLVDLVSLLLSKETTEQFCIRFCKVLLYNGHRRHLGYVTKIINTNFGYPDPQRLLIKFNLN